MLKKIVFTISFIILSFYGNAQRTINDYKYIIIPKSYEFSSSEDQYQLNSLTKFLFNKYGYEAYFAGELPEDLKVDRCLGLTASVSKEKTGMFKTRLEIMLKDCFDVVVVTSKIGESRSKEYKKAYTAALRDAFETFQNLDYKYIAKDNVEEKQSVKKKVKVVEVEQVIPAKINKEEVTEQEEISIKKELYYAQKMSNGFQLVNSEPRVVMILLETAAQNVFIVKGKSAIVYKEDGFWYYSENNGELGEQITMNIKF
jgi:hypothetical protein